MEEARANYNTEQRRAFAKKGWALPDGSFPIANAADLKDAIRLAGNGKDPAKAKAHIRKRAKALGLEKTLPAEWSERDPNSNNETSESKNISMSTKDLHDRWLAMQPQGAPHEEADCIMCQIVKETTSQVEDSMADKTYTEEDLKKAVTEAVKPLQDRLNDLEGAQGIAALQSAIDEAIKPHADKVAELQKDLDVKVAEAEASKKELEDVNAYLKAEDENAKAEAEKEGRKADRIAKVKANASYKDEYINEQADRWTEMDDAAFEGFLADLKSAGVKGTPASQVPDTKLQQGEHANDDGEKPKLASILELRRAGVNAARI